jgi:hypothetical protein
MHSGPVVGSDAGDVCVTGEPPGGACANPPLDAPASGSFTGGAGSTGRGDGGAVEALV